MRTIIPNPKQQARQRLEIIRLAQQLGVTLACQRLGVARSSYYYWLKRYQSGGWPALLNRSTRPRTCPHQTNPLLEQQIIELRQKTHLGKERLHDHLKDQGILIPIATIGNILARNQLCVRKRTWKTQKKHRRCYNLLIPGQRVQMDIKYVPSEKGPRGRQLYQYTVIDECTRLRYLAWHDSIWNLKAVQTLQEAQAYFGFKIDTVQTDNGIEFTFDYTAQLTAKLKQPKEHPLDVYCRQQNITHRLIPPGAKEINGKVERSHRTDDEEFYRTLPDRLTLDKLRTAGQTWLEVYNRQRKHSGIGRISPWDFSQLRLRLFPDRRLAA